MGLSNKLHLNQNQSLHITPQLLQAIKILQMNNVELSHFLEAEIEKNPLLERAEDRESIDCSLYPENSLASGKEKKDDFVSDDLYNKDRDEEGYKKQEIENRVLDGYSFSSSQNMGADFSWEGPDVQFPAPPLTLREHLIHQLEMSVSDEKKLFLSYQIIDVLDEAGYLTESLSDISQRLGVEEEHLSKILKHIQSFDPIGVGARSLSECLKLQLEEKGLLSPEFLLLLSNLHLIAEKKLSKLKSICKIDDKALNQMIACLHRLDPKPGHIYSAAPLSPIVPDVFIYANHDGSWSIELNHHTLPKILINQDYVSRVSFVSDQNQDKQFIGDCLQTAQWLTRSLDQRAKTILAVTQEIVLQQDDFFMKGREYLKPLTLKRIAQKLNLHESTISRVTSNKYLSCPRGVFELKYFFSASALSGSDSEKPVNSSETVKYKIKHLIDRESSDQILSDDDLVRKLKEMDIVVARRTVAKYRESLSIPSSFARKRMKSKLNER